MAVSHSPLAEDYKAFPAAALETRILPATKAMLLS
jgi:hypothetical protein